MKRKILVVSDLYLGGQPADATGVGFQICPPDGQRRLSEFFDWAAAQAESLEDDEKLQLVLNGDIVDFLAEADGGVFSAFTSDQASACRKLDAIFRSTRGVWDALGRYLATGSSLILLLGNHDVELTLPLVRRKLLDELGGGQGRLDDAKSAYERAVGAAPRRPQDIAVMRRQARSNLEHLGKDRHLLDDVLPVPGVAAFTGHMTDAAGRRPPRFPEARVGAVRESIRSALRARNVRYGVCSAARGSDLIFLDELLRRDGSAKVVLPFPSDAFKRSSVGGSWNRSFDQLLAAPGVELSVLMAEAPAEAEQADAIAECNREIEKLALEQAKRLDQRPLLLAVWNGNDDGKLGGTGDFMNGWRDDAERDVQIIEPF